jgi:hypothetical protein
MFVGRLVMVTEKTDRFESHKVYMMSLLKLKKSERQQRLKNQGISQDKCGLELILTLLTHSKPNTSHLIWMDKYRGESAKSSGRKN